MLSLQAVESADRQSGFMARLLKYGKDTIGRHEKWTRFHQVSSLKKAGKCRNRFVGTLLQNPVSRVLEDDYRDIRGDEFDLRPERNAIRFGPTDRQDRDGEPGLGQLCEIRCGFRERLEIREA